MVFEPSVAPRAQDAFLVWYDSQTEWSEPHQYDDPAVTSPRLAAWFAELIETFPPMNGPLASDDYNNPRITDYSVGNVVIYAAFAWSQAEAAYAEVRRLAVKHRVGFFDASGDSEVVFPPD